MHVGGWTACPQQTGSNFPILTNYSDNSLAVCIVRLLLVRHRRCRGRVPYCVGVYLLSCVANACCNMSKRSQEARPRELAADARAQAQDASGSSSPTFRPAGSPAGSWRHEPWWHSMSRSGVKAYVVVCLRSHLCTTPTEAISSFKRCVTS